MTGKPTITYIDYLSLPEAEKNKLPRPFLTVRWWDDQEVPDLTKQTWFSRLRNDINRGGKFSINVGIFKYEQAGVPGDVGIRESFEIVSKLFDKTHPITGEEFGRQMVESTRQDVFEPSLVVIDGELHPMFHDRRYIQLLITEAARVFGLETKVIQDTEQLPFGAINIGIEQTMKLLEMIGVDPISRNKFWVQDPENLRKRAFRGKQFVDGYLYGPKRQNNYVIAFPPDVVSYFVEPTGFGARVLGWLENGRPGEFFIRAISTATVDILQIHMGLE